MCKRWFLVTGIASFLTAFFGSFLSGRILWIGGSVALLLTASAVLCFRKKLPLAAIGATAAVVLVLLSLTVHTTRWECQQNRYEDTCVKITAYVMDVHTQTNRLTVRTVDGDMDTGVRLYIWQEAAGTSIQEGQVIKGQVSLKAITASQNAAKSRAAKASGVMWYATPVEDTVLIPVGSEEGFILSRTLCAVRRSLGQVMETNLSPLSAAMCKAIAIGDRDALYGGSEGVFRACGIVHVLAVSGLHISVVVSAVYFLLRAIRCPRKLKAVLTMLAVIGFMVLCGAGTSVIRSGCMTIVMLTSTLVRRRADGLNSMMMVATGMLIADPFAIYDVGWQLTFAAVTGLLGLFPVWQRETEARICRWPARVASLVRPVGAAVGVTLCASLTTLPLSTVAFGELSLLFLPGNLLFVPLASGVLIVSLLSMAVSVVFPMSAPVVFCPVEWMCRFLYTAAEWMANRPQSQVWCGELAQVWWVWAMTAAVIVGYAVCRVHGVMRMMALMTCAACLMVTVHQLALCRHALVQVANDSHVVLTVKTAGSMGAVFTGDEESLDSLDELTFRSGACSLDWMLWVATPSMNRRMPVAMPPIDFLILTDDPSVYPWLPEANTVAVMQEGDTAHLASGVTLERDREFYRLDYKGTSLLWGTELSDATVLREDWVEADGVILPERLPANSDRLRTPIAVICDEMHRSQWAGGADKEPHTQRIYTSVVSPVRLWIGEEVYLRNQ